MIFEHANESRRSDPRWRIGDCAMVSAYLKRKPVSSPKPTPTSLLEVG